MEIKNISDITLERIIKMMGVTRLIPLIKEIEKQSKNENELCSKLDRLNQDLIWYVCYGSNMYLKRFMCYLTGDSLPEFNIDKDERKIFDDQSEPIIKRTTEIPYEMYFGRYSDTWKGGAAFIKRTKEDNIHTPARAYLITKEQFKHVWKEEGFTAQWYGKRIDLDPIDGIPAITFTSEYDHDYNAPSTNYINCIIKGLLECGFSKEDAVDYISKKTQTLNNK